MLDQFSPDLILHTCISEMPNCLTICFDGFFSSQHQFDVNHLTGG